MRSAVLIAALALAGAAPAHASTRAGIYGGRTAQGEPVSLIVARDGNEVKRLLIRLNASSCGISEDLEVGSDAGDRIAISRTGAFSEHATLPPASTDRGTASVAVDVRGRVRAGRASGTARISGPLRDATGAQVATCDSGTVRFSTRRGDPFAGGSSQGTAVVLRVRRDRRRVTSFSMPWRARCGSLEEGGRLPITRLAITRSGRFGKRVFSAIPIRLDDGSIAQGEYVLRGRLRGGRASGTYRAFGSLILADGTKLACDTGTLRWSAAR